LEKLPIGVSGKDFCDRDCTIDLIEKSHHVRHRYEAPYRCELDCEESHEHNLCDFYCCIAYAENQTSRSEQYIFFEKAQS